MEKLKLYNKKSYTKNYLKLINATSKSLKNVFYAHNLGMLNVKNNAFYIKVFSMILLFKKCASLSKGYGRLLLYKLLNNYRRGGRVGLIHLI